MSLPGEHRQRSSTPDSLMVSGALEKQIATAVAILKRDGVVALPTDTLYGLGANIYSRSAVKRVFEIKGRPRGMALPVLLASLQELEDVAVEVNELALTLARHFWPGPLTLVVKRASQVPDLVTGGQDTVAVRVPNHPVPEALVRGLGAPITGTSANLYGGPDPIAAEQVRRLLGDSVDYIIDTGPAPLGLPSTVVDVTGATPRVIREGAVSLTALEQIVSLRFELATER